MKKSTLKNIINETVMNILKESIGDVLQGCSEEGELSEGDEFVTHGVADGTNLGGSEVQISDSGDAARFRHNGGEPTDWYEIQFDEDGVAYVDCGDGNVERLDRYMRVDVNESFKNWALGAALGAATLFGNPQTTMAKVNNWGGNGVKQTMVQKKNLQEEGKKILFQLIDKYNANRNYYDNLGKIIDSNSSLRKEILNNALHYIDDDILMVLGDSFEQEDLETIAIEGENYKRTGLSFIPVKYSESYQTYIIIPDGNLQLILNKF